MGAGALVGLGTEYFCCIIFTTARSYALYVVLRAKHYSYLSKILYNFPPAFFIWHVQHPFAAYPVAHTALARPHTSSPQCPPLCHCMARLLSPYQASTRALLRRLPPAPRRAPPPRHFPFSFFQFFSFSIPFSSVYSPFPMPFSSARFPFSIPSSTPPRPAGPTCVLQCCAAPPPPTPLPQTLLHCHHCSAPNIRAR